MSKSAAATAADDDDDAEMKHAIESCSISRQINVAVWNLLIAARHTNNN